MSPTARANGRSSTPRSFCRSGAQAPSNAGLNKATRARPQKRARQRPVFPSSQGDPGPRLRKPAYRATASISRSPPPSSGIPSTSATPSPSFAQGETLRDKLLAHIAPRGWEHMSFNGDYVWPPNRSRAQGGVSAAAKSALRVPRCRLATVSEVTSEGGGLVVRIEQILLGLRSPLDD